MEQRPAHADLRRATSTAYYAVFHQILRHGAIDFLSNADEDRVADVSRWFTHKGVDDAAGFVVDAASPKVLAAIKKESRQSVQALRHAAGGTIPPQLLLVADAFQTLQEARHSADYDGTYDPIRPVTINHVEDAEAALQAMYWLWLSATAKNPQRQVADRAYRVFLRLALMKSGGPKER